MFEQFAQRSHELERLDTGDYTPAEYQRWQREMKFINRFLGDEHALRISLANEIQECGEVVSIIDLGAGFGELLKAASKMIGDKTAFLVGAEISSDAVKAMNARSPQTGVQAVQCDALKLPFPDRSFDFAISSLFLHHLNDEQAKQLIREMRRVARKNFFIIDARRQPAAYYSFRLFGSIFLQRFSRDDGSLSILRCFKPDELRQIALDAGIKSPAIRKCAAFRLVLSASKNK